jgi:hypothetical protein
MYAYNIITLFILLLPFEYNFIPALTEYQS